MAEAKWYLAKDEKALGPFDLAELRQMAASGAIGRDDLVCPEGGSEWVAATTVPGLFVSPPPLPPRPGGANGFVPCAKCGKSVSDEAVACPHCGELQPKQDQLDGKYDGGRCEKCGAFNLLGPPGHFRTHPSFTCHGCRRPLAEAYPTAHAVAQIERVHGHWLEARVFWGRVAAVVGFAIQQFAFPFPGGWVVGLVCAAVGYALASYATRGLWRARQPAPPALPHFWESLDGYDTEEAMRNRPARDWKSNGTFVDLPRKDATSGQASDRAARPDGFPTRRYAGVAVAVLLVGAIYLYRTEFTQYELGRKAGVQHVREMSKKGPIIRAGMNAAKVIDLIPNNPNASADWNAGFRAGFKEELERMYPETKGR